MDLSGKVALVTGAASGLGKGIAECLAREGASVVVADIDERKAVQTAEWLVAQAHHTHVLVVKVDVSKEPEVCEAVKRTVDHFEHIDILVNNAGVPCRPSYPFINNTEEDWDRVLDINVKSIHFFAKAVWPYFTEQKSGRIINIGSIAGPINGLMKVPYSVSKSAVISLSRILAKEYAPYNVTVNAVNPGIIWTPFWAEFLAPHFESQGKDMKEVFDSRVKALVPLGRPQTPEDIGYAVTFLASDRAKNITGQVLNVDGGVVMW